ncbi:MAG: hypothetical protein ACR2RB_16470 [Gammaproteobacteria bacterium]
MTNDTPTGRFFEYLRSQLDLINTLSGRDLKLHRKILYVSMIDTVAGLIYPAYGNRDRFVSVLEVFGGWQDATRVSVPHLVKALERNPSPAYNRLRQKALRRTTSGFR